MRRFVLLILFIGLGCNELNAQSRLSGDDAVTRFLALCSESTPCVVTKSVVFFPIFPWFLYPYDGRPEMHRLRRFERVSSDLDFALLKANEHNSGYKVEVGLYRKWFGADFNYETYNNGDYDRGLWGAHFVFRLAPRAHLQPKFMLGVKHITTDDLTGTGFEMSFFNYDITFTRRFSMFIVNYIGWIKQYTFVEGLLGFEYYVYPTISLKSSVDVKHIFSHLLYGIQIGLSVKL